MTTSFDPTTFRPSIETPVWDRYPEATIANAQEVYPGVGDPLTFDINFHAIEHGFRGVVERLGLTRTLGLHEWPHFAGFASYYGRAHINISTQRELVKWVPGGDPDAIDEQLFGVTRPPGAPAWRPTGRQRLVRLRTLARLLALMRALPHETAVNEAAVADYLQRLQTADLTALSDAALMRELDEAYRRDLVTCQTHIANSILAGAAFEEVRAFLSARRFDEVDALLADLCTGLEDVESAKPGRELARLAANVRADDTLRAFLLTGPAEAMPAALRGSDLPVVRAFADDFDRFLQRYGYRGVREVGLDTLVWAQRPEAVINLLRAAIEQQEPDAVASLAEQRARREAATTRVRSMLTPAARVRFRLALQRTHAGIHGRELAKSQWARITHAIRLLVRECARRLTERGILSTPDDVFMLRIDELRDAMAGRPAADLAARIARQREELARCRLIETDERFVRQPRPRLRVEAAPQPATRVLRGLAVSPGRVTAPARVVRELTDEVELQPGEALVCPFTDAAWTPLFFHAAAVVMDLGGPLSHGATVAREYGLPAVVNVKTGTSVIKDGQLITIDGARGEVWLDPADAPGEPETEAGHG